MRREVVIEGFYEPGAGGSIGDFTRISTAVEIATYRPDWLVGDFTKEALLSEEEVLRRHFSTAHRSNVLTEARQRGARENPEHKQKNRLAQTPMPYRARRFANKVVNLAYTRRGDQEAILSEDRRHILTPFFDDLYDVSDHGAQISIGGRDYLLKGGEGSLAANLHKSKRVPAFLQSRSIRLFRYPGDLLIPHPYSRESIVVSTEKPVIRSDIFEFNDQTSEAQHKATALMDTFGQKILSYVSNHEELEAQLESDFPLQLPVTTINNKPAQLFLTTDPDGSATISLTSPGYNAEEDTARENEAWQLLGSLIDEDWLNVPQDSNIVNSIKQKIARLPGFHITRHGLRDGAVTIANGELDKKGVMDDKHPQFEAALDEATRLIDEYFAKLAEPKKQTLDEQRQQLAEARKQQLEKEALRNRSLGRKILDYLKS